MRDLWLVEALKSGQSVAFIRDFRELKATDGYNKKITYFVIFALIVPVCCVELALHRSIHYIEERMKDEGLKIYRKYFLVFFLTHV